MNYVFVFFFPSEVRSPHDIYAPYALCSRVFVVCLSIARCSFCLSAFLVLISHFLFVFLHLLLLSCIAHSILLGTSRYSTVEYTRR